MLATDLAWLYGVAAKVLNQAVRRNIERFPPDFMFQLSWEEAERSRSQFDIKYRPLAFTGQGVAMLSSVLKSRRAVQANVAIMRAFVRLRGLAAYSADLGRRLDALEARYDRDFKVVFDAIRELMAPIDPPPKRRIGFVSDS